MVSSSFIYTLVVWFEFACRVATYVMLILKLDPRFIRTVEALPTSNIYQPIMVAMVSEDLLKSQLLKSHPLFDSSSRPPNYQPSNESPELSTHTTWPGPLTNARARRPARVWPPVNYGGNWLDMMDMRMLIDGW